MFENLCGRVVAVEGEFVVVMCRAFRWSWKEGGRSGRCCCLKSGGEGGRE